MSRDSDRTAALRSELISAIASDTGIREDLAVPYADAVLAYLQSEYPAQKLYIPAPSRRHDVLQIASALERGDSLPSVMRSFGVSRTILYELFPGGLPRKQAT